MYRVSSGSTLQPHDYGNVGVIDGGMYRNWLKTKFLLIYIVTLKLTPMRFANIPPPMSLHEITVRFSIIDVCFWETSTSSVQVAVLDRKGVSLFKWNLKKQSADCLALVTYFDIPSSGGAITSNYQQVLFQNDNTLLVLDSDGLHSTIHTLEIASDNMTSIASEMALLIHELIPSPSRSSSSTSAWTNGGYVTKIPRNQSNFEEEIGSLGAKLVSLPNRIEKVTFSQIEQYSRDDIVEATNGLKCVDVFFGLTRNGSLYANDRCLAKDCTSFLTTGAHLIFTTSQHLLKFVHMAHVEGKIPVSVEYYADQYY